jgi:hypothetical protein
MVLLVEFSHKEHGLSGHELHEFHESERVN